MTSPSSGVKPIVVSTERAVADGGERRAGAEVAGDDAARPRPSPSSSAARRDA